MKTKNFIFLGSSLLSVGALEALERQDMLPRVIVTSLDKPQGRKLEMQESVVAKWVRELNIRRERNLEEEVVLLKLDKFKPSLEKFKEIIKEEEIAFALVASFGKILPESFLQIFPYGVLNIHPSDLPKYRGPSPIEAQILDGLEKITISIMQMTKEMDTGNVWYKESYPLNLTREDLDIDVLEHYIGYAGGFTFGKVINKILEEEIKSAKQDETQATYTRKYEKKDGNMNSLMQTIYTLEAKLHKINTGIENQKKLESERLEAWWKLYRSYVAFTPWPGIYFDYINPKTKQSLKIKISKMKIDQVTNLPIITHLTPEGKKLQTLADFENGFGKLF
jgi:methionyl-tRNA formyltransferase